MSFIDIVFMLFGAILICAGLYLFIADRKNSSNNHVEGFGIKLNVSNPSIILILSGIGLLVLPRFMPENKMKVLPNNPNPSISDKAGYSNSQLPPQNIENNNVYFPVNTWQLNSYQENGIEYIVPLQVNATMVFSNRSANDTQWTTDVFVLDVNGNVINNSYNGKVSFLNNRYTISFLGSSEPFFEPELNIPLELKVENGGILHMSYVSKDGEVIVHWQQ